MSDGKLGRVPSEGLHVTRGGEIVERASGIREDGSWSPAFPGQRPPFVQGNGHALIHGARASVEKLLPEARPLADDLEPLVPSFAESDRPALLLLAVTLRRVHRAEARIAAAEEAGEGNDRLEGLERYQRSWVGAATKLLDALGMTPTSRARLGLDLARGVSALEQYVEHTYPAHEEGDGA